MVYRLLQRQTRRWHGKAAVVSAERSLSYRELLRAVDQAAVYFQSLGLRTGDSIVLGLPPCPEFYIIFFSACALGLKVMPVLPSGKIPRVIVDGKPEVAVGDAVFLAEARRQCGGLKDSIPWDRIEGLKIPPTRAAFARSALFREQPVIGVSSSGSTGVPSIYFRSAELLVRRAQFRARSLGIRENDVLLSARPFNSGSSINSHVVLPIVAGATVVVQEKFQRFAAAKAIEKERVTVLYSVPFIFELLASIPRTYSVDLSYLRLCISGSAPLSPAVANGFHERFGIRIRQRYGGSHIHPAFTYNMRGISQAVGQTYGPFPITILSDEGKEVESGTIGEIAFDFSRVARPWKKYLKANPNRRGRFIYTGDLGRTDAAGNVFVVGRKSRFIKVRGNRVEPAEVEDILRSHPKVKEAFVFALNPGAPDEAVGAIVVPHRRVAQKTLLKFCAEKLEGY
ncbi:MAG TPA: class I adenylate-forming enzyme family protein, partial [Terriglobales bacterium]|nr:class I adenylate-forming enzyme family protein [Terriglobales bacterium]